MEVAKESQTVKMTLSPSTIENINELERLLGNDSQNKAQTVAEAIGIALQIVKRFNDKELLFAKHSNGVVESLKLNKAS